MARIMAERSEDDGAYICRQGEVGHELYIIYQGELEIIKSVEGQDRLIYLAKKGDCVGELAVLGNIPRTASLRAKEGVHLLVINGDQCRALLSQHPDMSLRVIKLLVDKLAAPGA